jgi:hypothetical protein
MSWNEDGTFYPKERDYNSKIEIDISAETFPGTYYVSADTFARNEKTGKDEMYQIILPKVKVISESNTITMEAEGDPTVFNMSLKVLKPKNRPMMQMIQYSNLEGEIKNIEQTVTLDADNREVLFDTGITTDYDVHLLAVAY